MNSTDNPKKEKLWTPMFVVIIGIAFMSFLTSQGLNAGTTVYIDHLGGSALFAGYLASAFSVMAGVARMSCGTLMDLHGRRMFILGGSSLLLISTFMPIVLHDDVAMFIWRVLQGAGFGTVTTAISTAAADVLPSSRLGEGIGYFGLGQALAMAIGPAVAITLASMEPPELIFIGLSMTASVALILALLAHYEKHPQKLPETSACRKRWEKSLQQEEVEQDEILPPEEASPVADEPKESLASRMFERRALPGAIPFGLINALFGYCIYFIGLYGTTLEIPTPGLYFTCAAVFMVILRLNSGAFMDKVPLIAVYTVSITGGVLACTLLIVSGLGIFDHQVSTFIFYGAGIFYGMCNGLAMPVCQTVVVKNTPPERWGAGNALFLLSQDVVICVSVIIWGFINDSFGFQVSLVGCIMCVVASYIMAWIFFPKGKPQNAAAE